MAAKNPPPKKPQKGKPIAGAVPTPEQASALPAGVTMPVSVAENLVIHPSIASALRGVMVDVSYIQKTKKEGSGVPYAFVGEAELIAKLHPVFVRHGLSIVPTGVVIVTTESYTTKRGADMNRSVVVASYKLLHFPSNETLDLGSAGEGADHGDKSTPKALTSAYKYVLRQLCLLETGDDPDYTPSSEQERDSGAKSIEETFKIALPSIEKADTLDLLEKRIGAARERKFGPDHQKQLEAAYRKRKQELAPEEEPAAGGDGEDRF